VAPVPGATNYVWAVPPQATIISGAGTNSITVEFKVKPGDVTVKPANQCGSGPLSVLPVQLLKCYNPFHPIFRVNSQNEISIYPNPSKSEFNCLINGFEDQTFSIIVFDYSGRIVEDNENIQVNNTFSFGKNLASGFYFVEINSSEVKEIFKIVKVE
jgi:hypothetical protein